MNVYSICGYFADDEDNSIFDNYLVTDTSDVLPEDDTYHLSDNDIFYSGLSEEDIKEAIENKELIDDFYITSYEFHSSINFKEEIINNQREPEDIKPTMAYDLCKGYELSSCCEKPIIENTDFCSGCKEHAGNKCEDCSQINCKHKSEK